MRIQFSLRVALLMLTLACIFIGVWHNCRNRAIYDVKFVTGGWTPDVVAPFILRTDTNDNITIRRHYHCWCLGAVIELPFTFETPNPNPIIMTVAPRIIFQPGIEQELGSRVTTREPLF